jgi:type I restriction-modification system DNA methylase subunit
VTSSVRSTNTSLAEFARSEGSKGGEFFTPRAVVRLMVEMIEPHGGKVFDPACGSGGMFVRSAHFSEEHRKELKDAASDVYLVPADFERIEVDYSPVIAIASECV